MRRRVCSKPERSSATIHPPDSRWHQEALADQGFKTADDLDLRRRRVSVAGRASRVEHDLLDHLAHYLGCFGFAIAAKCFMKAGNGSEIAFTRAGMKHDDAGSCYRRQPLP
ncbi:hypothetical protein L284_18725 [Novosphingobium lindaniclasticum LE124]|uniref:Uncharacterized protein n=1 Tax=Novosphingobium lindaniclasticum LE124 TaxID=1096930 RepID=T0HBZ5_9SPHN|nr:hypothetical protein L284_18725 [Novosphingobium lindaniclasticum LE124]